MQRIHHRPMQLSSVEHADRFPSETTLMHFRGLGGEIGMPDRCSRDERRPLRASSERPTSAAIWDDRRNRCRSRTSTRRSRTQNGQCGLIKSMLQNGSIAPEDAKRWIPTRRQSAVGERLPLARLLQ
jgi:hypothetical protein